MPLSDHNGKNNFNLNNKSFTNRAASGATPIYDVASSGGTDIPSGAVVHAYSSGARYSEGQFTAPYPSSWTGGAPDKVIVSHRVPAGNDNQETHIRVVSFNSTKVTLLSWSGQGTSWAQAIYADILLVKN